MPKTLFLVRHGKAEEQGGPTTDFERRLTEVGAADAANAAQWLKQKVGSRSHTIVCSAAFRAAETAQIIAGALPLVPMDVRRELYLCPVAKVLEAIAEQPDQMECAIFIGHEPTISRWVNSCLSPRIEKFTTAGIAAIRLPIDSWTEVSIAQPEEIIYKSRHDAKGLLCRLKSAH